MMIIPRRPTARLEKGELLAIGARRCAICGEERLSYVHKTRMQTRAPWWGQVGPYVASEVASSLATPPARVVFGSRRLTLTRDRGTCHLAVSSVCCASAIVVCSSSRCSARVFRSSDSSADSIVRSCDRSRCREAFRRAASGHDGGREDSLRIVVSAVCEKERRKLKE